MLAPVFCCWRLFHQALLVDAGFFDGFHQGLADLIGGGTDDPRPSRGFI